MSTGVPTDFVVRATAAHRIGVTLEEYERRRATGEKWCTPHRAWHPVTAFGPSGHTTDGLAPKCREASKASFVATLSPHVRGTRAIPPRDGDRTQAQRRINHLIEIGLLPRPNSLPCVDCGHEWREGERRHEYDHHLGYAAEHHEHVEALCVLCHHRREERRMTVLDGLTYLQLRAVQLRCLGLSRAACAEREGIQLSSMGTRLRRVRALHGLHDDDELVREARRRGWDTADADTLESDRLACATYRVAWTPSVSGEVAS